MTAAVDAMNLACHERVDLADLLTTFTPAQWNAPSLCAKWRVRDVVAHMFSYEELGISGLIGRFITGGVLPDRVNAAGVAAYAEDGTDDLITLVKDHLRPSGLTAGFGGRIALTDGLIQHQDIRRPLGLPRRHPHRSDPLRHAIRAHRADHRSRETHPRPHADRYRSRLAAGKGPAVEGPAEALLMAIAGRRDTVHELSGAGQPTLAARIGA